MFTVPLGFGSSLISNWGSSVGKRIHDRSNLSYTSMHYLTHIYDLTCLPSCGSTSHQTNILETYFRCLKILLGLNFTGKWSAPLTRNSAHKKKLQWNEHAPALRNRLRQNRKIVRRKFIQFNALNAVLSSCINQRNTLSLRGSFYFIFQRARGIQTNHSHTNASNKCFKTKMYTAHHI